MAKKFFSFLLLTAIFATTGLSCSLGGGNKPITQAPEGAATSEQVELNYWRVFDDSDSMSDIISAYQSLHPNVTINYRKLRYDEYEQVLVDALAEDRGPDIFSVHNTWVTKYKNKILPAPKKVTLPYTVTKDGFKKEQVTEWHDNILSTPGQIQNDFLDVVYNDAVRVDDANGGVQAVYGLPLSVDNMALFYNRDLLNNAGIATPAADWEELVGQVKKLTIADNKTNQINQAGVAMGTSANVDNFFDLISILMIQNGAIMVDESGQPTFDKMPSNIGTEYRLPSADALRFYTDFASPAKGVYSWNEAQQDALDAFCQGKLAYFFGYSYYIGQIAVKSPKLRYGVTAMPQITKGSTVSMANYWLETVSKKSKNSAWAWDFVNFAASKEQVAKYLDKTHKPTALKALVSKQITDDQIGVFAQQLLSAKSWYRGKDPMGAQKVFSNMINAAQLLKGSDPNDEQRQLEEVVRRANEGVISGW